MRHRYSASFRDEHGLYIASGTVAVYLAGTSSAANIYTDVDSATHVHSVTTNSTGRYTFFVDRFDYDSDQTFKIVCSKTGYTSLTIDNITIEDACVQTYTIADDTTVTTNVFAPVGCIYSVATGKVLTFSGKFDGSISQHFDGAGTVVFGAGAVKEIYPEWWGATRDGITDDSVPLQAVITCSATNKHKVKFTTGTYLFATGLTGLATQMIFEGSGMSNTILYYTGAGTAFTWGNTAAETSIWLTIRDITIKGTASGAIGLDLIRFQGLYMSNVDVYNFSAGTGIRYRGVNTGLLLYCLIRGNLLNVDYNNLTGNATNLITMIGGQISGGQLVSSTGAANSGNRFIGVNMASGTVSPAINITGNIWTIDGCFFEGNLGGVGTASIELNGSGCNIVNNLFSETNVEYGVLITTGNGNNISNNHNGAIGMTALVRTEAAASQTKVWGNHEPAGSIPHLSEGSGSLDTFTMGQGTDMIRTAAGFFLDAIGVNVSNGDVTAQTPVKYFPIYSNAGALVGYVQVYLT
jgi:hypothetical protein